MKRKERKIRKIDEVIGDIKEELEIHKESTEFITITAQLNKELLKKDKEVQNRKIKNYTRDFNDIKNDQVFSQSVGTLRSDLHLLYTRENNHTQYTTWECPT